MSRKPFAVIFVLAVAGVSPYAAADAMQPGEGDGETLENLGAVTRHDNPASVPCGGRRGFFDRQPARINRELARGRLDSIADDVGTGQGGVPTDWRLKRVTARMQRAATVLDARDFSGAASAAQQEALAELDEMLVRLQQQCEKYGSQSALGPEERKRAMPGDEPGPTPGESNIAEATSAAASAAASDTARQAAIGNLVQDLWGDLPRRQRDELLQPLSEEFLPEYAADIEEYFRVLAESSEVNDAEATP